MAIIENVHFNPIRILPEEIADYLNSSFIQRTDFIADVLSFNKAIGDANTTPIGPSTLGRNGLIDGSSYWTSRTGVNTARFSPGGFALTSDASLVAGGNNGSAGSTFYNTTEKYSNALNSWTYKVNLNSVRYLNSIGTFTSNLAMNFGGNNSAGGMTSNLWEIYNDAAQTWVYPAAPSGAPGSGNQSAVTSFTNDLLFWVNLNNSYRVSYSANSFTATTAYPGSADYGWQYASMTSDTSIISTGGYNTCNRFSNSLNTWVARTVIPTPPPDLWFASATSMTSDLFMSCGGRSYTGPANLNIGRRFSDSANAWISKPGFATARYNMGAGSLSSSIGLYAAGANSSSSPLSTTDRYTDNSVILTSGFNFISNQINNTSAVPDTSATQQVLTNTLTSTVPQKIIVGGIYSQLNLTQKPTVDISSAGGYNYTFTCTALSSALTAGATYTNNGQTFTVIYSVASSGTSVICSAPNSLAPLSSGTLTYASGTGPASITFSAVVIIAPIWGITGQAFDTVINTSVLSGSDFRLRINLPRLSGYTLRPGDLINANTWVNRTITIAPAKSGFGTTLSSDLSLTFNGMNGPSQLNFNSKFQDSANTWYAMTVCPITTYYNCGASFTNDLSFQIGGFDLNSSNRFSNSANVWIVRSNFSSPARRYEGSASLTNNLALAYGGYNQSGTTYTNNDSYTDSTNSWVGVTALPTPVGYQGGANLSTDVALSLGGSNGTNDLNYTYRYSYSSAIWSSRNNMLVLSTYAGTSSMTTDSVFSFGNYYVYQYFSQRYSDSGNIWVSRAPTNAQRWGNMSSSPSSNICMCMGGETPGSAFNLLTERYCDGETYLQGFAMRYL